MDILNKNKEGAIKIDNLPERMPQAISFGYQLLLDLYNCKPGACDDIDLCYKFLDEIVDFLGMAKQAPPYIFRSDAVRFPDKAGLSGWAPLIESSIVIHTLTPKNFISIDIYCCKEFDIARAVEFTHSFFLPGRINKQLIERGRDYYCLI
ncbi:MAG: S-adenosylmethionine decarboxylase [Candidatus Omnitrophota bacterium]